MENETPIQTESVDPIEVPKPVVVEAPKAEQHVAYMMMKGDNSLQYKAYRLVIDEKDNIIKKEMIGNPDLKAVVFGRLLKLLFVMR